MALNFEAVKQAARAFAEDAKKELPVQKTYLFGSYARGAADELSDVDICFFVDSYEGKSRYDVILQLLTIGEKYRGVYFEPIVFPVSEIERGNPFVEEIISTGQELV
jgi:predicted nucleotidyltransferase